jgi:hypothetical protein
MCAFVLGAADVTVVFMNVGLVGTTAFGTSDKRLGVLAVRAGVAEAEAATTLEEGGAVLEGTDGGLAAKEVGGGAFHQLKALPVWVVEGEDNTGVMLASETVGTAKPARFRKNAASCTYLTFHEFTAENSRGDRAVLGVSKDWYPAQENLSVAFSRGSVTFGAEGTEEDVIVFGDGIQIRLTLKFEDEILSNFLCGPTSGEDFDFSGFRSKVSLDPTNNWARVTTDMLREGRGGERVDNDGVFGGGEGIGERASGRTCLRSRRGWIRWGRWGGWDEGLRDG